jgi:hypothetical protein
MSNPNLRNITNHFLDARLLSLSSWRQAGEFQPKDRGGPYIVLQEGYDPNDMTMTGREFILGRSGKWLALEYFYQLPVAERRDEFVFGKAAEVMQMMGELPPKVVMFNQPSAPQSPGAAGADEMAAAIEVAKKNQPAGAPIPTR